MSEAMGITDRLFALRRVAPFDRLRESDLARIAEVSRSRSFAPGDPVRLRDAPASKLQVVVSGRVEDDGGRTAGPVIGLDSLLLGQPAASGLVAGTEGAETLEISRGHLFTILYECPALTVGFLERDFAEAAE